MGCNYSLANSLLYYELKCLGWVGVWWFEMVWVVLIFLIRMDWFGYSLVSNPFAGLLGVEVLLAVISLFIMKGINGFNSCRCVICRMKYKGRLK